MVVCITAESAGCMLLLQRKDHKTTKLWPRNILDPHGWKKKKNTNKQKYKFTYILVTRITILKKKKWGKRYIWKNPTPDPQTTQTKTALKKYTIKTTQYYGICQPHKFILIFFSACMDVYKCWIRLMLQTTYILQYSLWVRLRFGSRNPTKDCKFE